MDKEKIISETLDEKMLMKEDESADFDEGVELAYHKAIFSLKKIHGYGSETVQTLVALIHESWYYKLSFLENGKNVDEKTFFANIYSDYLLNRQLELQEMHNQVNFNFLVNAVMYYGGMDLDEMFVR